MSALTSQRGPPARPAGDQALDAARVKAAIPFGLRILRGIGPVVRLPFTSIYVVPRHDGVREVFGAHASFHVPYKANLDVITGGEPFFLGTDNTSEHDTGAEAMRRVMRADDLPKLGERAETQAEAIVDGSGGRVEVVDQLVRRVTFDMLTEYFGIPEPAQGRLDVWATRLFEFQFASSPKDHDLRKQVEEIAPAFRAHIDREIGRRKVEGDRRDDVLGRCLALQAAGEPGFSDVQIRSRGQAHEQGAADALEQSDRAALPGRTHSRAERHTRGRLSSTLSGLPARE